MIQATLPRRAAAGLDLSRLDLNQAIRDVMQPWASAYDSWRSSYDTWNTGVVDMLRPYATAKGDCGCPTCQPDPCACRCCVTDADLVIEARVGERRIVPIHIENRWRRERDIELELSSWTSVGKEIQLNARILGQTAFKLEPCGRAEVVLVVDVAVDRTSEPNRELPDVDRCEVAYADLRIKGCDLRSIRIAVALLPRDCEAYTVDCACSCCC